MNAQAQDNTSTFKIEEKTEEGWNSVWKVEDMPKTAGKEFEKAKKGSVPAYDEETEYRLTENGEVIMEEVTE